MVAATIRIPATTATRTIVKSLITFGAVPTFMQGTGRWGLGKNHPHIPLAPNPVPSPQHLVYCPSPSSSGEMTTKTPVPWRLMRSSVWPLA